MASGIRPMLPPLHEGHRVPPLNKVGTWHPLGSADPLQVIARGLSTVERPPDGGGDIVSVPDIWAQLTVFHNALAEENHPGHPRAVAEWRGLLACFALAAYRVTDLTSEVVPVPRSAGGGRWADLVGRLPPQCALLDGERLHEVGLVRVGGRLVALAQPLTLLAPSRSLADHRTERPPVPWMLAGRFQDPLLVAGLSRDERAVLARFLAKLCADLEAERDRGRDVGVLLGLARSFSRDAAANAPTLSEARFQAEPARLGLPGIPVFRALQLRESVGLVPGEGPVSDCLLRLRPGLEDPALRGVILYDPKLHEQLSRPAGEVKVWDRFSLRMLQERPELLDQVRSVAQSAGYLVVAAEELFLPRLYRADGVEGEQGFVQHPPGARGHLLPLSPLVVALLDRRGIASACRLASAGAGGVTVNLRLALDGGHDVTLSRHYPEEEGSEPPYTLAVWPDFQADWWRLHLGYSGANPSIQFVTAGLLSLQGVARALASSDQFSAVAAGRALAGGNVASLAGTTWLQRKREAATAFFELPGAPEAALLEDRRAGAPRLAGLLLLPEPKAPAAGAGGASARVGIDFGTTNTAAYLQVGAQEPEPLRIAPRHITAYHVAPQSRDELDVELLPVDPIEGPFQTILRDRMLPQSEGERRPFRDTLIYFAQRRRAALERVAGQDDLFANLKWGDDQPSRERVELFLSQVVILALAEVAARGVQPGQVSFRFSFPEAFRPQHLSGFKAAALNAVRRGLRETTGAASEPTGIEYQTESVATAQYFIQRLRTPATEGLVTFDVGGQTTDVAIVQSRSLGAERLAWRGSFQLAGRHLLIEYLRENRGILDQLARGRRELWDLVAGLPAEHAASPEKRTLATELLVNSRAFAEAFDQVLPTLAGIQDAERLRAVALAGLAGLFDYVGRTVRWLAETGRVEGRANNPVFLCLGGRASLLFGTLLRGEDEREAALGFFTDATGGAMPRARLVFSKAPKQEVAYGLVRDDRALIGGVPTEPLLGEGLRSVGGVEAAATDLVSSLDTSRPWRIEDPAAFRDFVGRLHRLGIRSALPASALGELAGLANDEMRKALGAAQQERLPDGPAPDTSTLEPPFVVLLRQFVHRLATDPGAVRAR